MSELARLSASAAGRLKLAMVKFRSRTTIATSIASRISLWSKATGSAVVVPPGGRWMSVRPLPDGSDSVTIGLPHQRRTTWQNAAIRSQKRSEEPDAMPAATLAPAAC